MKEMALRSAVLRLAKRKVVFGLDDVVFICKSRAFALRIIMVLVREGYLKRLNTGGFQLVEVRDAKRE